MGAVAAAGAGSGQAVSPAAFRAALAEALDAAAADERIGPLLRAANLRVRLQFPDIGLDLDLRTSDAEGDNLEWRFAHLDGFEPRLVLRMDSAVANAYLQGKASLAIAIARGAVRCQGESRMALAYLPTMRLLSGPYRRVVEERHPALAVADA